MLNVTCALIINRGKLLVAQLSAESVHPLKWEFPGGKIKLNESAEQCIKREIKEELGILIDVVAPIKPVIHDYGFRKVKLIPFVCKLKSGRITLKEHEDFRWIKLNELLDFDLAEADKKLIEENRQVLKKYLGEKMDYT